MIMALIEYATNRNLQQKKLGQIQGIYPVQISLGAKLMYLVLYKFWNKEKPSKSIIEGISLHCLLR